jgi:hypothetical protein
VLVVAVKVAPLFLCVVHSLGLKGGPDLQEPF